MKMPQWGLIIGIVAFLVVGGIFIAVFILNSQARNRLIANQAKQFEAPATAVKQEVKRILLKRQTKTGEELVEIHLDGRMTTYTKDMKPIKTRPLGYGQVRNLFNDIEQALELGKSIHLPPGVSLIIETNKGTLNLDTNPSPGPGDSNNDTSIIDEIIDVIDRVLNPTPMPSPSVRPPITPRPSPNSTPAPLPTPNPSALPDYMNAKEFTCDDYYKSGGKPLKISNVYCGMPNQ